MSPKFTGADELTSHELLHYQSCKRMTKLREIIKAWSKVIDGLTTSEHKRRSKICSACPHAKNKKILNLVSDELIETKGMICDMCGCPLSAKIRSNDICKRWEVDIN